MPIVKCKMCGKEFNRIPSKIKKSPNHFCSKECMYKSRLNWKKVICNYCGKEFLTRNWQFEKFKLHFCDKDCQQKYAKENHINQFLNPIPCKYCGKIFKPITQGNVYCSHKCWSNDYRKKPEIILKEDYAIINVKYKNKKFEVLIDLDDVEKCEKYSWQLLTNKEKFIYFRNSNKQLLHRYIMNCPEDMVVDHINHNTLDNRKENLRICTFKENTNNRNLINKSSTTGYTYINVKKDKFVVIIKRKWLGTFKTVEEALIVRDEYLRGLGYDVDNM